MRWKLSIQGSMEVSIACFPHIKENLPDSSDDFFIPLFFVVVAGWIYRIVKDLLSIAPAFRDSTLNKNFPANFCLFFDGNA
eukprot:5901447-Ditylum_brightwellii.AAC.1